MQTYLRIVALLLAGALLAGEAYAQGWRGNGRVAGKVKDENGAPLEGVTVKAFLPEANGGAEAKANKKGEWAIGGIARGNWQLDFSKDGYEARRISVFVQELTRIPPIEISLRRAAPVADANLELRQKLQAAASLMNQRQFARARMIYEELLATYPTAQQLHPLIARTYYGENQFDKAIEHLRIALEKDSTNEEVKLLLGNVLVEKGDAEEGRRLLESIDESLVTDPTIYLNVGIVLLNQNKPVEAMAYFEKAVRRFPEYPDAYYYRGITHLQMAGGDPQQAEQAKQAARADLTKFVELAPDAPEAAIAKKILEQLK